MPAGYRATAVLMLVGVALAAWAYAMGAGEGGRSKEGVGYPRVADLVADNDQARVRAISEYVVASRALVKQLTDVVASGGGPSKSRVMMANACYLLGSIRTSEPQAVAALVKVVAEEYSPGGLSDIPFAQWNPGDALISIGKPSVGPVLEALAGVQSEKQLVALRRVLEGIEGVDCAIVRIRQAIAGERDGGKRERLQASLDYFAK